MDITDTTATADKILSSYGAYGADGVWMSGSASGGGGLEYEEGTFEPEEDISDPIIYFTNAHTERPAFVCISDTIETVAPYNATICWTILSWYDAFGNVIDVGANYPYYARTAFMSMGNSAGSTSSSGANISTITGVTNASMNKYLSNSWFCPYCGASSRIYSAGRTYKWIAVWAPVLTSV